MTILTQVGGLVYLLFLFIRRRVGLIGFKSGILFIVLYLLFTFLILPPLASIGGRVPLPASGSLRPLTIWSVVLNRHYVDPELKVTIQAIADEIEVKFPGSAISYLDANFPFIDGFPMFPHLSHNDGKKLDLAFKYMDRQTRVGTNSAPSFMGYGIFEGPKSGETDYPTLCKSRGYWQYGFIGKLIPKWNVDQYSVDEERTRFILLSLVNKPQVSKIFIEPHLKERWGLSDIDKIRFHGCQAVRHDDHIHFQIQ